MPARFAVPGVDILNGGFPTPVAVGSTNMTDPNASQIVTAMDTSTVVATPYIDPSTNQPSAVAYQAAFDPNNKGTYSPNAPTNLVTASPNFGYTAGATAITPLIPQLLPTTNPTAPVSAVTTAKPSNFIMWLGAGIAAYFGYKYFFKKGRP